jgi:hypothetical protein
MTYYGKFIQQREEVVRGGGGILYYSPQFTLQLGGNKHSTQGHPPTRDQYKAEYPSCGDTKPLTVIGAYSDAGCILSGSVNMFKLHASVSFSLYRVSTDGKVGNS